MQPDLKEAVPPLFAALEARDMRADHFAQALDEARRHLADLHYAASLGKFREAVSLSHGDEMLESKVFEFVLTETQRLLPGNWRVANALAGELQRLSASFQAPEGLLAQLQKVRDEELIQNALDSTPEDLSLDALRNQRARLLLLLGENPQAASLVDRLHALDRQIAQQIVESRESDLRRLLLFRDRLDACDNPRVLHEFPLLVSPFTAPHPEDAEFISIVQEVASLAAKYDAANAALANNNTVESSSLCSNVLALRPSNVLFLALQEKVKAREWVARLAESSMQSVREFEQQGRYDAALEELESLRQTDPQYPGLDAEILHCSILREGGAETIAQPVALEPEAHGHAETDEFISHAVEQPQYFLPEPVRRVDRAGYKIAMTAEAWAHLKTGLAATMAILLAIVVLAIQIHRP